MLTKFKGLKTGDEKPRDATEIAELFQVPVGVVRRAVRESAGRVNGFAVHKDGHWQRKFDPFDQLRLLGYCVHFLGYRWN
jgi:hypothetical protein